MKRDDTKYVALCDIC
jgi:hypothetical protein